MYTKKLEKLIVVIEQNYLFYYEIKTHIHVIPKKAHISNLKLNRSIDVNKGVLPMKSIT